MKYVLAICAKYAKYPFEYHHVYPRVLLRALAARYSIYEERPDPPCTKFTWNLGSIGSLNYDFA